MELFTVHVKNKTLNFIGEINPSDYELVNKIANEIKYKNYDSFCDLFVNKLRSMSIDIKKAIPKHNFKVK